MIFGLGKETMHSILSDIASDLSKGHKFAENKKLKNVLSGDFDVLFKSVKQESIPIYAGAASDYYERSFRVLVMFWPDKSNILPTESGCELTVQNEALTIV